MYTRAQIKEFPKGFTPSETDAMGNRKSRRATKSNKGLHQPGRAPKLLIDGLVKYKLFTQRIFSIKTMSFKIITHSVLVNPKGRKNERE